MKSTIDRDYPLPIYYQLKELLRERIAGGEWLPGTMIPSERELSELHGISRMTVRQAIAELVTEGILRREQGKGTFVAEPKIEQRLNRLTGFTEDMWKRGLTPGAKVLRLELIQPSFSVLRALQITPEQPVVLLERLRLTSDEPIALEISHLHFADVHLLLQEDFENGSLYIRLAEQYGVTPTRAEQQIGGDLCSQREQELLKIPKGSPVLRNRRITYDQWGKAFEFVQSAYRADRYVFYVDLNAP